MDVSTAKGKRTLAMGAREERRGRGGLVARVYRWIVGSAWASLALKTAMYLAGFMLLALVGSGRFHCVPSSAPSHVAVGIGEAVAALPVTAAPSATASVSAVDRGEAVHEVPSADAGAPILDGGITPDGKVLLNHATEEELHRLPGVGPTRAKAIVALRTRLGRFRRAEDLLRVKGIGRRTLTRLRPLIVID